MALPNPYSTSSMGQGSSALSGDQSSFASSMRPGQGSELGSSALSGDQSSFASSMRPGGSTEPQSGLQQMNFGFSSSMQSRILHDDLQGHSVGWNPGGPSKTFIISDSSINPKTSLVLINTVQSNFVICSVDYLATGFFEVNCNVSPANNAELHYLVINGNAVAGEMSSGNVTSRIQNNTQANIQVPRELSKNPNQLIDEINSTSTANANTIGGANTDNTTNSTSTANANTIGGANTDNTTNSTSTANANTIGGANTDNTTNAILSKPANVP